jgi:hypothetical protein
MIRRILMLAAALIGAGAAQARSDSRVAPYLEVDQVVTADLNGPGDVLTYTSLAAGVDATVSGRNAEGQISYRYEHRFGWGKRDGDDDVHSGLARGRLTLAPGLNLEAGGIASRARSDIRGAAPGFLQDNDNNIAQVYSAYVGPTLATHSGVFDVTAAYRFGYTKVDPGGTAFLAPGQPRLDQYDHSTSHYAAASIGMSPTNFPVGWQLSGMWQRETTGQLDQRFDDRNVRLDLTRPITHSIALVGSIGYETIRISQRPPLRDEGGVPVVDGKGRFVTDKAAPRLLAYDSDGLIWDVGVSWRPSHRTSLEARAGRRYGSMIYTGSFNHQMNREVALSITAYDGPQSFSRQLNDGLSTLPTQFNIFNSPLTQNIDGCVYGTSQAGGCLDDVFQSISTSQYRARGVNAVLSINRGRWNGGVGVGYAQRRFIAPRDSLFFSLDGVKDQSWFGQAQIGRKLTETSSVEASVYANYYESGIALAPSVTSTGATAAYYRMFGHRLSATASLGIYTSDQDGFESDVVGSALLGMRYTF